MNGTFTTITFNIKNNTAGAVGGDGFEIALAIDAPPVAQNDAYTTNQNTALTGNLFANNGSGVDSDVRGDALTVNTVNGASFTVGTPIALTNGSLTITNATTGAFTFTPNLNFFGTQTFTYNIRDPIGNISNTSTDTTTIVHVNQPPVGVPDSAAVVESGVNPGNTAFPGTPSASGNVLTNDTDPDAGDTKTVSAVNGLLANVGAVISGSYGTVKINADGTYSYTLNNALPATQALAQGQVVSEVFNYTVKDTAGATSSTTLTVSVTGTNDAPVANPDSASTPLNVPLLNINVKANDTDVDNTAAQLTVSAPTINPAQGSVTLNPDGTLNFTPASGVTGPVTISYTLTDSFGASSVGTLTVTVGANTGGNASGNTGGNTAPSDRLVEGTYNYPVASPSPNLPGFTTVADPALHVLFSTNDARSEIELRSGLGHFQADSVTMAELTGSLRSDLEFAEGNQLDSKGLGGERNHSFRQSNSLFVQHAVRHEALGTEQGLFVQDAVRGSQRESLALGLRVDSFNSAVSGVSSLFDPFALGAPSVDSRGPAAEADLQKVKATQVEARSLDELQKDVKSAELLRTPPPMTEAAAPALPPQRRAADGFGVQLRRSATDFRPRVARTEARPTGNPGAPR